MLILGCGYIGRRVAHRYQSRGERVLGVVRSAESAAALEREGIRAVRCDLAVDSLGRLPLAGERVFHFLPPPGRGVEDPHTRRLVSAFDQVGDPKRLVYISTSGVYGDCEGAWVDETRPARPSVDRARRRWDAEQTLRRWRATSPRPGPLVTRDKDGGRMRSDSGRDRRELVVLRVAGIYGPGRLPLERIRRCLPLVHEPEAPFSNRIHADDLVEVCVAAMERGRAGALYNACDGSPSTMTDYFCRVADVAGLPRPPTISLDEAQGRLSTGMMSYMRESRRLSNRRVRQELGVQLRFPALEDGIRDCLRSE